jgi:hypothetical protein
LIENAALEQEQRSQIGAVDMVQSWHWLWATVAFASELAALAALAVGGWSLPTSTAVRVVAAVGLPLVAAGLWGMFAAPHAVVHITALAVLTKVVVYGAAVLALVLTDHPRLAVVLAVAAVLGSVLSGAPSDLVSRSAR